MEKGNFLSDDIEPGTGKLHQERWNNFYLRSSNTKTI